MRCPGFTKPSAFRRRSASLTRSSVCEICGIVWGSTPQYRAICRRTGPNGVKAMIGATGRCFDTRRAVIPISLNATIALAPMAAAADQADVEMASGKRLGLSQRATGVRTPVLFQLPLRADTIHDPHHFDRILPDRVSAESITASVPSNTAFATSEASARVGRMVLCHRLQHLRRRDHQPATSRRLRQ